MKPSDNPFKPGTEEFNDWNKNVLMAYQRTPIVHMQAVKEADRRLARLKESYPKGVILDPDIDHLVNGTPEPPVVELTPFRKHIGRIAAINETWQRTEQYVVINSMLAYMPQIDDAPDWVTDKTLYSILIKASLREVEEVKQQHGYMFYAVTKPLSLNQPVINFSVDQVRVHYEKWMR